FAAEIEAAKGWNPVQRWWRFRGVHRSFGWRCWAFVTGGASLSEESERFWRRLGFAVLQGYGMTETASLITVNHPFKKARGSVGKTLPGQEIKLGEGGEILVRGANVTPGYWKEGIGPLPDDPSGGGWLRTGDIGEMDAEGNIYFKGRKKDVIVTAAGLNVYPEDIEAALDRQPEIKLSAVVGVEGPRGPEPLAVLILKEPDTDPAPAVERANETLARHQHVRRWAVWPDTDFPRTATQKVRKRDIVERLGPGAGGRGPGHEDSAEVDAANGSGTRFETVFPGPRPPAPGPLEALVTAAGAEGAARLDSSAKLATDLKLDSLGRVELLSAIEDRYQIEIDESAFTAATTLGDIERLVRQGGGGGGDTSSRYPYPRWAQRFPVTWFRVAFYYAVVLPITSLLCWVRVRGAEHVRDLRGPVLFVSNHITYFDHALIMSALPGRFRRRLAIAQEGERLRWWRRPPAGTPFVTRVRWLMQYALVVSIFNTFSLPQKSGFRRSFAYAGETMDRGYSVLVFPEGTRSTDGRLCRFMGGAGLLATKLDAPVVPVYIRGLYELKQSGRRGYALPGSVTIVFGEPVKFGAQDDPAEVTREIERRVAALAG
ncbi:MAG TPA: 1-acyl-sn-glycerol-3-phosphate acyltransferase, partial [Pyrinomonadaceae bacterium]|nr:1-acyl-sn-glycerol-3-phosphate acyltransferase [Pyrinomonadaceae bacterium]